MKVLSEEATVTMSRVILVIPARNEEESLRDLLPRVPSSVDQIIVVDNGSTDETRRVAAEQGALVVTEARVGYGAACATGLRRALAHGASVVVFMDADGSDDPTEIDRLLRPLSRREADLVIGRRRDRAAMHWHQRAGTDFVCGLLSLGFSQKVRDIGPFRAATADALRSLPLADRGYGWTAEMQAQAMRAGFTTLEVDVSWQPGIGVSEISGNALGVLRAARDLTRRSLREIVGYRLEQSSSGSRILRAVRALQAPVAPETRAALAAATARIPERFRGPGQFMGRQYAGCGALIGAMPRCDFACQGCYLGSDANRVPPLDLSAIDLQIERLRDWLGEGGNLQLTDGELTLREPDELVELVRRARAAGLVPMLMTHGDALLRSPDLLLRLVREGGLSEISIHIDTTQRGRRDRRYRTPQNESDLNPLRRRFAELIRAVRHETRLPLEVATTVTVTRENLTETGAITRFLLGHADVFKMVSFQPVAAVGRTQTHITDAVDVAELWEQIEKGLGVEASGTRKPGRSFLGHPDCSQFLQGLVVTHSAGDSMPEASRFVPVFDPQDTEQANFADGLLERVGGLTFRLDDRPTSVVRLLGVLLRHGPWILANGFPQLIRLTHELGRDGRTQFLLDFLAHRIRLRYFNVVSHHFMNREEIATPIGQERVSACAFRVSIDGELRSMCEVNAMGIRETYYARMHAPGGSS